MSELAPARKTYLNARALKKKQSCYIGEHVFKCVLQVVVQLTLV